MKRVFATAVVWIGVILSTYYVLSVQNFTPFFNQLFPVLAGGLIVNLLIVAKKQKQ